MDMDNNPYCNAPSYLCEPLDAETCRLIAGCYSGPIFEADENVWDTAHFRSWLKREKPEAYRWLKEHGWILALVAGRYIYIDRDFRFLSGGSDTNE